MARYLVCKQYGFLNPKPYYVRKCHQAVRCRDKEVRCCLFNYVNLYPYLYMGVSHLGVYIEVPLFREITKYLFICMYVSILCEQWAVGVNCVGL